LQNKIKYFFIAVGFDRQKRGYCNDNLFTKKPTSQSFKLQLFTKNLKYTGMKIRSYISVNLTIGFTSFLSSCLKVLGVPVKTPKAINIIAL